MSKNILNIHRVFNMYTKYGSKNYIGEKISQLQHATQTAMQAERYIKQTPSLTDNFKKELILGAFLHDIGHLIKYENNEYKDMGNYGVYNHELYGSLYLKKHGFTDNICKFAENHITTKKYLVSKYNNYYNLLSDASKESLKYQGNTMTIDERIEFEKDPLFDYHMKIRQWDDLAKSDNSKLLKDIQNMEPVNYYQKFAENLLQSTY